MCLYDIICNFVFNYQGNKQMKPVWSRCCFSQFGMLCTKPEEGKHYQQQKICQEILAWVKKRYIHIFKKSKYDIFD